MHRHQGVPEDEAVDLIAELDAHCLKPQFQYRHKWQVGDLLMWDNATSMHLGNLRLCASGTAIDA